MKEAIQGSHLAQRGPQEGLSGRFLDAIRRRPGLGQFLLLAPPVLYMGLFMVISVVGMFVFSLMKNDATTMTMQPLWNLENWRQFVTQITNWQSLVFTVRETVIVLVICWLVSYPIAYFTARMVKDPRIQIAILLLAIIPFWTSYTVRMIAWLPVLGETGLLNSALMALGILKTPSQLFMYTEGAQVYVMVLTYALFTVGPIYFSISQVSQELLDAAADLGANSWRAFIHVILPLSFPGMMTGSIFVSVLVMGEFATPRVIGGTQNPLLGNNLVAQASLLQFPQASVTSAVLVVTTLAFVLVLTRFVNIRAQL
ncbi:MAG: ABC transporter permease [Chloroflexi bacterium]|nr:ABC transporter permease [Chloroflexota bacterium]